LIVVKITKENLSPVALLNNNAAWALSFNLDAIKRLLKALDPRVPTSAALSSAT
jgi:hypothetical protein